MRLPVLLQLPFILASVGYGNKKGKTSQPERPIKVSKVMEEAEKTEGEVSKQTPSCTSHST